MQCGFSVFSITVYWIEQLRMETDPVCEMCSAQNTGW